MASITGESTGPQALDAIWLDEVSSQVSGLGHAAALFSWDAAAGADFTSEVESVSRLFPHLDGLPAELTGERPAGVAQQAAVCGRTSVALGAGEDPTPGAGSPTPGSPADQCLMSPSEALLASPDPSLGSSPAQAESVLGFDWMKVAPSASGDWMKAAPDAAPVWEVASGPAEHTVADKITTMIEFVEPARGVEIQPPPAEEILVSPDDLDVRSSPVKDTALVQNGDSAIGSPATDMEISAASPVEIKSPAAFETTASSDSTVFEQDSLKAESPEIAFLRTSTEEEDEHTRMIDQALEDLKTLESMCGITADKPTTASASSLSTAASSATDTTPSKASSSAVASPAIKPEAAADTIKPEPIEHEDADVEIIEERPPPRRRRRRPPRVAVTPAASSSTQIVIMLTADQLAGIQKSGQIVLNAAALQPSLAVAESLASEGQAQKAQKTQLSARAQSKLRGLRTQTVTKPSAVVKPLSGGRSVTVVKPASTVSSTITSGSRTVTSAAGTSGAPAGTKKAVKRPQIIVKPEAAKRAKRTAKRPAGSKDPLSGWMDQKTPAGDPAWDFPLLPSPGVEQALPPAEDSAGIPDDLQDLLLDGADAGAVPSLPSDAADCLLEELISGSVRENPGLFDDVPVAGEAVKPAAVVVEEGRRQQEPLLVAPAQLGYGFSPQPQQQLSLDSWLPTLCPSPGVQPVSPGVQPVSPASDCGSPELAPGPDWTPSPAARRGARRPRPYDKQPGGRRQPMTEEERRERKKEQNKMAATRYRQKKKEEHDLVSGDQEALEARNKVLRDRVGALSRELNYLKQLMREVLRHKQVTA